MSAPTLAESGVETVEQCMDRVRGAVNNCVFENGYQHQRTAAYWRLGMDPMPGEGTSVEFGTVFGLPHGSVVRVRWRDSTTLWTVLKDNVNPERLAASATYATGPYPDTAAEVVLRTDWSEPVWRHRNHFLHGVWEMQRHWRRIFDWCAAVERALEGADLPDPGSDAPPPRPVSVHGVLTVGYSTDGWAPMTPVERAAFEALPDGAVASPDRCAPRVKQGRWWMSTTTLRRDFDFYDRYPVVVVSLGAP